MADGGDVQIQAMLQVMLNLPVFGIVLVATHLGLLFWEMKYLSITLGAPGLKPARPGSSGDQ